MINLDVKGDMVKITDDWCDENTISKIKSIMKILGLSDNDIVDWEITSNDVLFPDEKDKELANEKGDYYLYRDRYLNSLYSKEKGSECIMTWDETLILNLNADDVNEIKISMLFIMGAF